MRKNSIFIFVKNFGTKILLFSFTYLIFFSVRTFAADLKDLQVIPGINTLEDLINVITNYLIRIAYPVSVLVIMYGGFRYFLGANDEGKTNGMKTVQSGVTGLIIVLMADAISNLVKGTFAGGNVNADVLINFLNNSVINNLTALAVVFATLAIIWGGYKDFIKAFDVKTDGTESVKSAIFGISVIFLAGAFARTFETALKGKTSLPDAIDSLQTALLPIFTSTTGIFTALAVVISTLVIAKGGFDYYQGTIDDKAKGIETIRKGVLGLATVLLSNAIANLIKNFFGASINNTTNSFDFKNLPTQSAAILKPVLENGTTFLLNLTSVVAILVVIYGAYQYYAASFPGQKAEGQKVLTNGVIGLIVSILARPIVALIQVTLSATEPAKVTTLSLNATGIITVVKSLLSNIIIPVSSVVTVFFIVLGGYYWITSSGSDQVKKAREAIQNAIVGFVVTLLATTMVQLIIFFVKPEDFTAKVDMVEQRISHVRNVSPTSRL